MNRRWRCGDHELPIGERTLLMGVVNVTPDSFSDGGQHATAEAAVAHGHRLVLEGADILDVGGESTRPGSTGTPVEEEIRRIVPVITALSREVDVPVSVDTRKSEVAEAAFAAGASIVNDVSAGTHDPRIFDVVREHGGGYVLMHMQGEPATMQDNPTYDDVVAEVGAYLRERAAAAEAAGIPRDHLALDPGIGFGKTLDHNLQLLRATSELRKIGYPLLIGVSRKGMIGALTTPEGGAKPPVRDRVEGTLAAGLYVAGLGADVLRVHDVKQHWRALRVYQTLRGRT